MCLEFATYFRISREAPNVFFVDKLEEFLTLT